MLKEGKDSSMQLWVASCDTVYLVRMQGFIVELSSERWIFSKRDSTLWS